MESIARLASPTGQWPEAVHPKTHGGCMGDGEQIWAAAEWVFLVRNCFVREEEKYTRLILCSGIPPRWSRTKGEFAFGPAPTSYGTVSIAGENDGTRLKISWSGTWHLAEPEIDILVPGFSPVRARPGQTSAELTPIK
jgi:hypothetical protein